MDIKRFFSKKDFRVIASIFFVLIIIISLNLQVSLRKGRDSVRKNDLSALQGALDKYLSKYREFPESHDGKIVGCFKDDTHFDEKLGKYLNLRACEWGVDGFEGLEKLPRDPYYDKGRDYLYLSNGSKYQIFISLEGKSEAEYTESVVRRRLSCGDVTCNYGKSYGGVPIEMSLEEYEETVKNK